MTNKQPLTNYADKPHALDPDIRFLLANERTLLAWTRTGLTLQAGGLALIQLVDAASSGVFGIGIILFGAVTTVIGYVRYRAADKAIRSGILPRTGVGPVIEVGIVVAIALLLSGAYMTGLWK